MLIEGGNGHARSHPPSQVVMIGRDIQILILDVAGDRVRLGITAPREILVLRQELPPTLSPRPPQ
jgi:carbon storage regulator CsrA